MSELTIERVQAMVTHWLNTPTNGYLGSRYGSDPKSLLMQPMNSLGADEFIEKLKNDVPILRQMDDSVNIYAENIGNDTQKIYIEIGGEVIKL